MKKPIILLVLAALLIDAGAQKINRKTIFIPDISGFVSLKCDFHMHTVFSDGRVWPDMRVEEAFKEGLDAIAITDHIEYRPHKKDITANHNRPYELASWAAEAGDIILIKGVEITRSMPPGHLNALFIEDADSIDVDNYEDALQAAKDQGAFIFWNHPGWEAQAKEGIKWYDEHTRLFEKGLIDGIEIVNDNEFYPQAFQWCMDKKLSLLCNSDIHGSLAGFYEENEVTHRPMTIVFSKDRTAEGIKEALFDRRTIGWFGDWVIGPQNLLFQVAISALEVNESHFSNDNSDYRRLVNKSSFEIFLTIGEKKYHLRPLSEMIIPFEKDKPGTIRLTNFITEFGELAIVL